MKQTIIMLPFTLTSILFIQSLSPMVISYRAHYRSIEVARHKALRSMNIAFSVLFITVFFFYAISFNLTMGHDVAVKATIKTSRPWRWWPRAWEARPSRFSP